MAEGSRIARGIRKLLQLFSPSTVKTIEKQEIEEILFHRGRMLLLDRVVVADGKAVGEFNVTNEVCEGHVPVVGQPVMKGSDLFDMAAQLLGVWASQFPELHGLPCKLREYGGMKIRESITPGEKVTIELNVVNGSPDFIVEEGALGIYVITGMNFSIKSNGKPKAKVHSVSLAATKKEPEKIPAS